MTRSQEILTRILAATDAAWIPSRDWDGARPTNVYFARLRYPELGVPWEVREATEAGRKSTQRAVARLIREGLVTSRRRPKILAPYLKLTDAGDVEARALAGLPGLYSAWVSALELAKHSRRPPGLLTDAWVCERELIGDCPAEKLTSELVLSENMLLPAIVRGYVVSNSDARRCVRYALTRAGWAWLDAGVAPPADDLDGTWDRDAVALYDDQVKAALARLDTDTPENPREIGILPLPVSVEGEKLGEHYLPG